MATGPTLKSKFVPASPALAQRWRDFRQALNEAATPYIRSGELSLSIFYLQDLVGAEKEMDAALRNIKTDNEIAVCCDIRGDQVGFLLEWEP